MLCHGSWGQDFPEIPLSDAEVLHRGFLVAHLDLPVQTWPWLQRKATQHHWFIIAVK